MKKSKLLTSLAALALVLSFGACSEPEEKPDEVTSSEGDETSESGNDNTSSEGNEDEEEEGELITSDPEETIAYMFDEGNGLDYDVSWWTGVDYYFNYIEDYGDGDPFYYTTDATLVGEESGFASGLLTNTIVGDGYDYTEYDYLVNGLVYTHYTDDDEFYLYDLSEYEEDTQYYYSLQYFLDDTQLDITYYCTEEYLSDYLEYVEYGYDVTGSITTSENWTKAKFAVSAFAEEDGITEEMVVSYELVWDEEGKLIDYADDYYYLYSLDFGYFTLDMILELDTEAALFEGPAPEAPDWVEENYEL